MTNQRITRLLSLFAIVGLLASCAKVNIKDGLQAYEQLQYQDAIHKLSRGLQKQNDPEARRALAQAFAQTNRHEDALQAFELLSVEPSFNDQDRIAYGQVLMTANRYEDAEDLFNGVLSRDPDNQMALTLRNSSRRATEIRSDSSRFDVTPMFTGGVTTAFAPFVHDGKVYFSGAREGSGEKDPYTGLNFTDLYVAQIDGANFNKPAKVEGVNGRFHDGIATLSADGNTMILTRSNYGTRGRLQANEESVNTMQLYISTKSEDGKWSEPQLMPFSNEANMYAHPVLSSDGKTLYFSSDMSGGFGGMDLYKSTLENDTWSKPVNLGANINTPGNEVFPSLRSDDSLYFSSNAHQTLGGLDILYSVNREGEWSAPTHLAYPVNTGADDFGMAFTGDGTTGFFSSDRSGRDAIYAFVANEVFFNLKGLITRKFDDRPIEGARVTITNLTDGTEEEFETDELGMFEHVLDAGKNYKVRVEKDGFFAVNENVSTKDPSKDRDINMNISLLDISNPEGDDVADTGDGKDDGTASDQDGKDGKAGPDGSGQQDGALPKGVNANKPYQVPNILWDYDKYDIREDARPYLDYVAKLLKDNPDLKVEVRSHCDSRGSHAYNDPLSNRRAKAVTDYLVSKGVKRSMLISKGYGKRQLTNRCETGVECSEEEHQANRRTEFKVLNK